MTYTCGVCRNNVDGDIVLFRDHTEKHIIDLIKHDHPDWVQNDGVCLKCAEYYRSEIKGSTFKDAACAIRTRKAKSFLEKFREIFKK